MPHLAGLDLGGFRRPAGADDRGGGAGPGAAAPGPGRRPGAAGGRGPSPLAQALGLDRALGPAHQALAESYEREGDEGAALQAYQAWIAVGPRTPLPYNKAGALLERRQDWAGALAAYRKSLEVEWNQPPILEARGRLEKRVRGQ